MCWLRSVLFVRPRLNRKCALIACQSLHHSVDRFLYSISTCRDTSDTGPFVLRAWAPCSVQLEQLPAPYSLTPRGQWLGSSAGGSRAHVTWASNPHILITCPREATALLCLQRPDVCNSLVPQPFDASGCISLTLCQPQASAATGRLGTPAVAVSQALLSAAAAAAAANSKVVGATDGSSMDRAALLVKLQPDTPYALVPSTAQPGTLEAQLLAPLCGAITALPCTTTLNMLVSLLQQRPLNVNCP